MTVDATVSLDACPRRASHLVFRWEASQDAYVILYPEGLVKLNASAGEILKRCDGMRSVSSVIAELQAAYAGADGAQIADATRAFIDTARHKGWLQW
ncbi:pyrroloquinoline quinone biosynthesis peptide chaperone PqqD [Trinickia caryophylli]|nr:pyrroloquinoline quinone biosynthesis peptide chaperone PqqD [Trinickia caryophylli]PMS13344.1 pyrroloquinoline quinone biosynthesis peptide chaperone PqqD [Trinickia caryophylli]TRX20344.1 pyrroloquinoline quinone biosynthesis peptide chaperone PqqD [Trinickia caryophylli]WQE13434.1 pyrroloquinoline quinone biosynthesis peptide chaperone PqqD [Trinickia caryophylli]